MPYPTQYEYVRGYCTHITDINDNMTEVNKLEKGLGATGKQDDLVAPVNHLDFGVILSLNMVTLGPIYMGYIFVVTPSLLLGLLNGIFGTGTMAQFLLCLAATFVPLTLFPPLTSSKLLNTLHLHPSQFVGLVVLVIYGLQQWLFHYLGSSQNTDPSLDIYFAGLYLFTSSLLINEVKWTQAYFDSQWTTSTISPRTPTDQSSNVLFLLKRALWRTLRRVFWDAHYISFVCFSKTLYPNDYEKHPWAKYLQTTLTVVWVVLMLGWIVVSFVILPRVLSSDKCRTYQQALEKDKNYHPLQWNDKKSLEFYGRDEVVRHCGCSSCGNTV